MTEENKEVKYIPPTMTPTVGDTIEVKMSNDETVSASVVSHKPHPTYEEPACLATLSIGGEEKEITLITFNIPEDGTTEYREMKEFAVGDSLAFKRYAKGHENTVTYLEVLEEKPHSTKEVPAYVLLDKKDGNKYEIPKVAAGYLFFKSDLYDALFGDTPKTEG